MTAKRTENINLIADIAAPLAIELVTVALFFTFMPDNPGTLFWFNMGYTSVLEMLLFAYIVWLPHRKGSVVLKWMCGTYTIIYIGVAFFWMLLFAVLLDYWCPLKVYFSVVAVLTVIWIYLNATTVKIDNINEESVSAIGVNRAEADIIAAKAEGLLKQFNLMKSSHPELSRASSPMTLLCRGLATLSPVAMKDPSTVKQLHLIISGLEEVLEEAPSDVSVSGLKDYAAKSIITLDGIKKSIRK